MRAFSNLGYKNVQGFGNKKSVYEELGMSQRGPRCGLMKKIMLGNAIKAQSENF